MGHFSLSQFVTIQICSTYFWARERLLNPSRDIVEGMYTNHTQGEGELSGMESFRLTPAIHPRVPERLKERPAVGDTRICGLGKTKR